MIGIKGKEQRKAEVIIRNLVPAILPVLLVILWEVGVNRGSINGILFPKPTRLAATFQSLVSTGKLWKNLSISFLRVGQGFLLGMVLGVVLGILLGLWKPAERMFAGLLGLLRPIPFLALIPVFILILGIGETQKAAIIAYGTFWSVFLNTISGIQNVDVKLIEMSYLFRIGKTRTITKIILPAAVPSILTGLRLGVSAAWMSVVGAEMIAATSGIGYEIAYARTIAKNDEMYVCVFVIGIIGLIIDKGLVSIQKSYIKKTRGLQL
ncbi:MAG: ABC transporter permease [Lachnospiraceae bacterium]